MNVSDLRSLFPVRTTSAASQRKESQRADICALIEVHLGPDLATVVFEYYTKPRLEYAGLLGDASVFRAPTKLTVQGDYLYVGDSGHECIFVFSIATETLVRKFGFPIYPVSFCVQPPFCYVTTPQHELIRLDVETSDRTYFDTVDAVKRCPLLRYPCGVSVYPQRDELYVADTGNHCIRVFDCKTRQLAPGLATRRGMFAGELEGPHDVAIGHNQVFVAETMNHRVQVFDLETGESVREIGAPGDAPDELNTPRAFCLSGHQLYIADSLNHRVVVRNAFTGRVLDVIGQKGAGEAQFRSPSGIAVTADKVYVADADNRRVQIFHRYAWPVDVPP